MVSPKVFVVSVLLCSCALQLVSATALGSGSGAPCEAGQFQCSDGACISRNQLCNGVSDCSEEEDEFLCLPTIPTDQVSSGSGVRVCSPGEFQCSSGRCIPVGLLCDGSADCPGQEDELLCVAPSPGCMLDEVRCFFDNKCISLAQVCNGVEDCTSGFDEANCPPPGPASPCAGNEFACTARGPCIPLALWCDGAADCPNGQDEGACEAPVVVEPPLGVAVSEGDTITLTCSANGTPPPLITWTRNLLPLDFDPRYQITSEGGAGVLTIFGARGVDDGEYHCRLMTALSGTSLVQPSAIVLVNSTDPFLCEDRLGTEYPEGTSYLDLMFFPTGPASTEAADIIFVVDESGSMAMEHDWLRTEVSLLDRGLQLRGVGVGSRPNLFALVGFGRNDINSIAGVVISPLATPEEFIGASADLMLSGVFEDGFSGIDHALRNIQLRPDTARQIILITDEERDILRFDLTRDIIAERLADSGFILNAVVNQGFLFDSEDDQSFALGLGENGTAYYLDENSPNLFATSTNGIVNPSPAFGFQSTVMDYVELALSLGGIAWDLNQLRLQGNFAAAFTNAFTEMKVEEVAGVFVECFQCTCTPPQAECTLLDDVSIQDCFGVVPILTAVVTPELALVQLEERAVFECVVHSTLDSIALVYSWEYPVQPMDNIRVVGSTLTVLRAGSDSEGVYTCTAMARDVGISVSANATLELDSRCILPDGSFAVLGDIRFVLSTPTDNLTRAADIVLVVDESGSMVTEHAWIPGMASRLDQALIEENIGVQFSNWFGLVGFGDDCGNQNDSLGRVLTTALDEELTTSANVSEFTADLATSGRSEDGYTAIRTAYESYEFRESARQFILITDEDRDILDETLTRVDIEMMLESSGVILNAAISEEFSGGTFRALGIDQNMNAYVYDPSALSLFRVISQAGVPIPDSAYGTTNSDYTQLALGLGGAAWDLSILRQGGMVAEAFTQAFVQVKVNEVRSQLEECFNCTCTLSGPVCQLVPAVNFTQCLRVPGIPLPGETPLQLSVDETIVTVQPGQQRMIICEVNNTASLAWTFNGGPLPSGVESFLSDDERQILLFIVDASIDTSGVYTCLAHSRSELFNAAVSVSVMFEDPALNLMVDLTPLNPIVTTNENVTFICTVPDPALFAWMFDSGPLPTNSEVTSFESESLLILTSVNSSNNGIYTCVVNNTDEGVVNDESTSLTVVEPTLQVVAESTISVETGSTARLTCEVACLCPGAVPQWTRPFSPLPPQAQIQMSSNEVVESGEGIETVLTIPGVGPDDGGRYICSAARGDDSAQTESFIGITESFSVVIEESSVTLEPGVSRTFTCIATRNVPSFSWTFNGDMIQEQQLNGSFLSSNISDDDLAPECVLFVQLSPRRSLLAILQPEVENSGNYACSATSDGSTASAVVAVDVVGIVPTASIPLPQPSVSPDRSSVSIPSTPTPLPPFALEVLPSTSIRVTEGENVSITCESTHPTELLVWTIFGFNQVGPNASSSLVSPRKVELTIANVRLSSLYVCSATSNVTEERLTVLVNIIVTEILRIGLNPQGIVTLNETELLNLTCTLGCECNGANLDWVTADGTPLPSNAVVARSDSMQSLFLIIEATTADAAGSYICIASFGSQTANKSIEVFIDSFGTSPPPTQPTPDVSTTPSATLPPGQRLLVSPTSAEVRVGSDFQFECQVVSGFAVDFEWTFSGQNLSDNALQDDMNDTSVLSFSNVQQVNGGRYICTAILDDGTSHTAFGDLIFIDDLRIAITPESPFMAMAGDRVEISCTLDCFCEGDIILSWLRVSARQLPPSAEVIRSDSMRTVTLRFAAASVSDSGEYLCEAVRDGTDVVTQNVTLVVQ